MRAELNPQVNMVALTNRIQPQDNELAAAKLHRVVVRNRLNTSFDVSRFVFAGSHARSTAIRRFSDLDLLVVLRRNEAKWAGSIVQSSTILDKVREDLKGRFPKTEVRADGQAVVIDFAAGQQSLDVVPVLFERFDRQRPVYLMPDGFNGWRETSPEAHDRYFNLANERSGGKLRKIVQLLKWWKFSRAHPLPIRSFYVDLLMANSNVGIGVNPYTHWLYQAFRLMSDRECRGMRDPLGIGGIIFAVQSEAQGKTIVDAVEYAYTHAKAALAAEAVRDFREANRQWGIIFNDLY